MQAEKKQIFKISFRNFNAGLAKKKILKRIFRS